MIVPSTITKPEDKTKWKTEITIAAMIEDNLTVKSNSHHSK